MQPQQRTILQQGMKVPLPGPNIKKLSIVKAEQNIMLIRETSTTTICRIEYLVTTGLLIQQPYQCQG